MNVCIYATYSVAYIYRQETFHLVALFFIPGIICYSHYRKLVHMPTANGRIVKDDPRYHFTQAYLEGKGHTFQDDGALDFIIFPFKQPPDEDIYNDKFFQDLRKQTQIFSGLRSQYLTQQCHTHGLPYHVMMEDPGTTVRNAVPTSEGVIAYLIHHLGRTIAGSRILVVGYGVCGSDLARRLTALGATTSALVRNRSKACNAQADGVTPIYLAALAHQKYHAIINTVPSTTLTNDVLGTLGTTLLIDIASAPYGFDIAYAQTLNPKSALLPAIPGKYAIQTAGDILGEYVDDHLRS